MKGKFSFHFKIITLRTQLEAKQAELRGFESKADIQLMEHRAYIERQERLHQKEVDKLQNEFDNQMRIHSDLIGKKESERAIIKGSGENENVVVVADDIKEEHKREKEQIKASFYRSLEQIKEEFANEITLATEALQAKHKKEMGKKI